MTGSVRLLLLNYEYPPAGGGAGFATQNIARALVRLGLSVDVLTARIDKEADGDVIDGVRVFRVPSWRRSAHDCGLVGAYSYVAFAASKRRTLHLACRYDLEHFFFALPTGALAVDPFLRSPAPYLVSLRGSDVPGYDPFNTSLERAHRLLWPLSRRIWERAAGVVALSAALRSTAQAALPGADIDVIPNGVDVSRFSPPGGAAQGGPLRLLTVSRLLERKGIHHLLDAIGGQPKLPVSLRVVGTGPYEAALRNRVARLGIADRVEFMGFVRNDDLPAHYRAAEVFVLPSQTESFGLVFAEAMASGLPIVATTVGGIPELVRSGIDGELVAPGSVAAVRAVLVRMLQQRDRLAAMGAAGRARILEKYTWDAVAQAYLCKYEQVLGHGDPQPCPS